MSKLIDMTNRRIGHLVVLRRAENNLYGRKHAYWVCKCDCGNTVIAEGTLLRRNYYVSCGCMRAQRMHNTMFKHGKTNTRIHKIWSCMKQRCNNPNYSEAHLYGDRGIKVCQEWNDSFETFYKWAMENGYKDDLSIDRIDVNGNYEPNNCRWATVIEQQNNRRSNHYITYNGETHSITEWSRKCGCNASTIKSRIRAGWTVEDALNKPVRVNRRWLKNI